MITEALRHCPGVGPARLARLHAAGVRCWTDLLTHSDQIPGTRRRDVLAECQRCLEALETNNVRYFVQQFAPQDKWRILGHFVEQTTFFDIETEGLDHDARITVVACWHRGELRTFVEHEDLDAFLELLDDVLLLASFNGSSFDVPRVLAAFHIPELPCPHVDLRWMCHHHGWKGGLKEIADSLRITRPADLGEASGLDAIRWWHEWVYRRDVTARQRLLRYCGADVLLLPMLAQRLIGRDHERLAHLWSHLPPPHPIGAAKQRLDSQHSARFGAGF